MPRYRIYDATVATTFPIHFPLRPSRAHPDLTIEVQHGIRTMAGAELVFEASNEDEVPPLKRVERVGDATLMTFLNDDQVVIRADHIDYQSIEDPTIDIVRQFIEIRLWGSTLALWMLLRGQLPIHGGTVWLDDGPATFLAVAGTGKSSMLASLIAEGHPLMADDLSPLWIDEHGVALVSSAYPQMRMWPETARRFVGDPTAFPRVYPWQEKRRIHIGAEWGQFLEGRFPLTRIFLLNRLEDEGCPIQLERLRGHEAFMEMLRAMFKGPVVPIQVLQGAWEQLEQVVQQVPIWRLTYPSGWDHIPDLHRAIRNTTAASTL